MSAASITPRAGQPIINAATGRPLTAAQALAAWLQANEPTLFNALAAHAAAKAPGLGDWSDILSSIGSGVETAASDIGSGISSAASAVGDYLSTPGGIQSLTGLANTYLQTQEAQSVTALQVARAQQGLAPAPLAYSTNAAGQVVPVYTGSVPPAGAQPIVLGNGATGYQLSSQQLQAMTGSGLSQFLQQYGLPLALAAGGLVVVMLLMRSRGR